MAQRSTDATLRADVRNRFEALWRDHQVVVATCDRNLRYTSLFSPGSDFDSSQIVGLTDADITSADGIEALMRIKARVLNTGRPYHHEIELRLGGARVGYCVIAELLREAPRGGAVSVRTTCVNITELVEARRAQEEVLEREHQLRLDAEFQKTGLNAVLNQAPVGVLTHSLETGQTLMNYRLARLCGEPVLPRPGYHVPGLRRRDDDAEPFRCPGERAANGETVFAKQYEIVRRDGTVISVEISANPVRGQDGEVRGVVITVEDITTRVELEQLRHDYVGMVAHDLRNPLNRIALATELLRAHGRREDGDFHGAVEKLGRAAQTMSELVEDLMEAARLESSNLPLHRQECDMVELVTSTLERSLTPDQLHRLEMHCEVDCYTLNVDEGRLRRVMTNLLDNAQKHSGRDPCIGVYLKGDDRGFTCSIADRGHGMTAEQLEALFRRYRASTASRQDGGSGLGLYICRLIVEAHGGHIRAESKAGEGSTFTFTLPRPGPVQPSSPVAADGFGGA